MAISGGLKSTGSFCGGGDDDVAEWGREVTVTVDGDGDGDWEGGIMAGCVVPLVHVAITCCHVSSRKFS